MSQVESARSYSNQDRSTLALMVTRAFEKWGLVSKDQLVLLGLSINNRAALSRYRKGKPLSASRDLLDRVGHLLSIHKNLRLIFPQDRELAYAWMTQRNRAFEGLSPVEIILNCGFSGVLMVRAYLDRAREN